MGSGTDISTPLSVTTSSIGYLLSRIAVDRVKSAARRFTLPNLIQKQDGQIVPGSGPNSMKGVGLLDIGIRSIAPIV